MIDGQSLVPVPVGFLVDGPWFAGLRDVRLLDYLTDSRVWLEANLHAVQRFPEVLWLPGFWAEFGMISNPPSFEAKCVWPENGFPTCEPVLRDSRDIASLKLPDVRSDGLLPLIIARIQQNLAAIHATGHRIRFAAAHGPLTIGSYLMDHTPFFLGMRTEQEVREHADAILRQLPDHRRLILSAAGFTPPALRRTQDPRLLRSGQPNGRFRSWHGKQPYRTRLNSPPPLYSGGCLGGRAMHIASIAAARGVTRGIWNGNSSNDLYKSVR